MPCQYSNSVNHTVSAKFLTHEEKTEVERRLKADRTSLADEYDIKFFYDALKDWKIYVHMLITIGKHNNLNADHHLILAGTGIYTPLYSISLFLPTIVRNMGYSNEKSQLMTVPPYVFACICTISAGMLADKHRQRGVYMIFFCLVAMVGFAMLLSTHMPGVQYAGTFFAAAGIYPNVPMGVAWNGNNIGGSTKRAVGIAMHVGFGNLGGSIAAFAYRSTDAPRYFTGHGLLLATTTMSCCLCVFMTLYLRRENARRDALMTGQGLTLEGYSDEKKDAERERGDNATVSDILLLM